MPKFDLRKLKTPARLAMTRIRITEYLAQHGPSDAITIRAALGIKKGTCSSQLSKGCEAGIFKRVGGSRTPGWIFDLGNGKPVAKPEPIRECHPERITPPSYRQMLAREQLAIGGK